MDTSYGHFVMDTSLWTLRYLSSSFSSGHLIYFWGTPVECSSGYNSGLNLAADLLKTSPGLVFLCLSFSRCVVLAV